MGAKVVAKGGGDFTITDTNGSANDGVYTAKAHSTITLNEGGAAINAGGVSATIQAVGRGATIAINNDLSETNDGFIYAVDRGTVAVDGTGAITNNGTIEAVRGGIVSLDGSGLDNNETLVSVGHGSTLNVSANVSGNGTVTIINGGQADFTGAFNEDVTFSGAGTLSLAQNYTGTISGFAEDDAIDFTNPNLEYSPREYAIWNQGTDTLTIYKGATAEETITLTGNYAPNSFAVVNDDGAAEVKLQPVDQWARFSPRGNLQSGRWGNGSNWSQGVVPTSATNAAIDGSRAYTVTIPRPISPVTVKSLAIGDPNATLDGSGRLMATKSLYNAGTIQAKGGNEFTLATNRLFNAGTIHAKGEETTFTINERGNGNANFGTVAALAGASLIIHHGGTATNELGGIIKAAGDSSTLAVSNKLGGENYGDYKAANYGTVSITNHGTGINEVGGVVEATSHGAITVTNNSGGENYGRYNATDNGTITVNNNGTTTNEAGGMVEATSNGTIVLNNNFNDANYGTNKADGGTFTLNVADLGAGGGNFHKMEAVSGGTFTINGSVANWSDATITASGHGSTFNFLNGAYLTGVDNEGSILAEHHGIVSFGHVGIENNGTIDADGGKINFDHSQIYNGGLIEATGGGTLDAQSRQHPRRHLRSGHYDQ